MKLICTSLFIASSLILFGQQESIPHQFWNNFSHFNPAYAGLRYQHQGGLMYQGNWNAPSQHDYFGFYNLRLKKNFGTGINMNHTTSNYLQTSDISVPISYDWNMKGKHHLGLGIAPSYRNHVSTQLIFDSTSTNSDLPYTRNHFQTHAGIVYNTRFFHAGIGIRNLHIRSAGDIELEAWKPHYYGHISTEVFIGSRSQYTTPYKMILSGLYSYVDGFSRIDLNARVQWDYGLTVFVGGRIRGGWTVGAGWEFAQKFRCMYSASWQRSKLSKNTSVSHELSLIYQLSGKD